MGEDVRHARVLLVHVVHDAVGGLRPHVAEVDDDAVFHHLIEDRRPQDVTPVAVPLNSANEPDPARNRSL